HQHGLAQRAVEAVDALVDHAVELLAAPGGDRERAVGAPQSGRLDHRERASAAGSGEAAAGTQVAPAVLDVVPEAPQAGDALVERDSLLDLIEDRGRPGEPYESRNFGTCGGGELGEDLPLRPRLPDPRLL